MSEELSVDQAVGLLASPEPEAAPVEPVEAAPEAPPEDIEEQEDHPEAPPEAEGGDGAETPTEAEVEQEPEAPAIEPPHFWSADAKARFAELPPDLQEVVLAQEREFQRVSGQKLEEATTARKTAEAQAKALEGLTEKISEAAQRAEEVFASRWDQMTPEVWAKLAQENPQQYIQLKAQHDADQAALQQSRTAKDAAERVQFAQWVQEQEATLKTRAPELADPVKGPENRKAVADYLQSKGVDEQALSRIGAVEAEIAWKALQYERGLASLNKPRPTPPQKPAVRPTGTPSKPVSATDTLNRRLSQTHSVDDAVALLQARRNRG